MPPSVPSLEYLAKLNLIGPCAYSPNSKPGRTKIQKSGSFNTSRPRQQRMLVQRITQAQVHYTQPTTDLNDAFRLRPPLNGLTTAAWRKQGDCSCAVGHFIVCHLCSQASSVRLWGSHFRLGADGCAFSLL